jgi:hypothetical protein
VCALLGALGAGPAAAAETGLLRIAHLSPDTPAVDVALAPLGAAAGTTDPGPDVAQDLGYSEVGEFLALPPGSYAASVRRTGAAPSTPPVLSLRVEVTAGAARTVAVTGRFADLSVQVLPDDLSAPPAGSARVRVLAAGVGAEGVDVALDGGPVLATDLSATDATDGVVVPGGPAEVVLSGSPAMPTRLPVDLAAGSVVTLLVLDGPGGLTVRTVVDAAGPARVPAGAVEAGGSAGSPVLAALVTGAVLTAAGRRRSRVLVTVAAMGTALGALPPTTASAMPVAPTVITAPAAPPQPPVTPTRLALPALGVDTALAGIDLDATGALVPPADVAVAGWHAGSAVPGEAGPAVIAGHVDGAGRPGALARLDEVAPGDVVLVTRSDGTTQRFTVTRVARYAKATFPTAEVYGTTPDAQLRLITCGGAFDPVSGSYLDNVVVHAALNAG